MKFDWKNWNPGGKIIFCSMCVAVLSMFFTWVDIGIAQQSGFEALTFFMLIFWVYPVLMLLKNDNIKLRGGLACGLVATISCIVFICSKFIDFEEGTVCLAGNGAYLCTLAALGLTVGVVLYNKDRNAAESV